MRDSAPGGNKPWLTSSPCRRSRRGARLTGRPRLRQQGSRRALTSPRMRQPLSQVLTPLARRCSVPRRIHLAGYLRRGRRGPWLPCDICVDTHLTGVDGRIGVTGAIVGVGFSWGEGLDVDVVVLCFLPLRLSAAYPGGQLYDRKSRSASRTHVHFCPQHWLLCHSGLY